MNEEKNKTKKNRQQNSKGENTKNEKIRKKTAKLSKWQKSEEKYLNNRKPTKPN